MSERLNPKLELQQDEILMSLLLARMNDCTRDTLYKRVSDIIQDLNSTLASNKIYFHKASEIKISLDKIENELMSSYSGISPAMFYSFISKDCSKKNIYQYADTEPLDYTMINRCLGEIEQKLCKAVIDY